MSGTSMDGVDAALCDIHSKSEITVIDTLFTPYPDSYKKILCELVFSDREPDQFKLQTMHQQLGELYASCSNKLVKQNNLRSEDIQAIANHGQTIRHTPNATPPSSLQIGSPEKIAELTKCDVIYDFRSADLMSGGQGAPLMPAFHEAILKPFAPSAVINIGGIANITIINKDQKTIGFDIGPGNTLMDNWIQHCKNKAFDDSGTWAKSGTTQKKLLARLLSDPYFSQPHPKSTGPDYFNLDWLNYQLTNKEYKQKDIQATLLALTTHSISQTISQNLPKDCSVYICGGGARNKTLIASLETLLPNHTIKTTSNVGVNPDYMEAIGFAWLGYCHNNNIPANLPAVTGASERVILGKIHKA